VNRRRPLAIVGASLAGAKAAEGAREAGYDGRVVLVGDEPHAPYERPPLSKAVLRGEADPDSARVHTEAFYAEHGIERIVDEVTAIDTIDRRLVLGDGARLSFETLVLATGAEPRRLDVPGAGLDGVRYLRTLDDSLRLRDAIRRAARVAVIGAGWIGSEVAASARQMGADVVLIDPSPVPLRRVLGEKVGGVFRDLHAEHGVALRLGAGVVELRGGRAVEEVVLGDGRIEPADVVVAGIGVTPRVALAEDATGLRVDDGVLVDQHLEANIPGIYAAGDVANAWHPPYGGPLRVEHWDNAVHQGRCAGANAAGRRDAYTRLPYFFSDQYDLGLEYVGHSGRDDEIVIRGSLAKRELIAFWLRSGIVTAAMNVNVWDVVPDLRRLVETGMPVDPSRLADLDVPLPDLVRSAV
jgi:3-phenylpropionate/trans-cinnamate dioxygenase ferredoxin reductase subunit